MKSVTCVKKNIAEEQSIPANMSMKLFVFFKTCTGHLEDAAGKGLL